MCGIIALVSRPSTREVPTVDSILTPLDRAAQSSSLEDITDLVGGVNEILKGVPGCRALLDQRELEVGIEARLDRIDAATALVERTLDDGAGDLNDDELERLSSRVIAARDVVWSIRNDRLRTARAVADLAGREASTAAVAGYLMIQQSLSVLDRLEVRGRDSAGIHVFVWNHGLAADDPTLRQALDERGTDPLFQNRSVRSVADGSVLSFVYKAAFNFYSFSHAAALSLIIFVILLTFSLFFMRKTRATESAY